MWMLELGTDLNANVEIIAKDERGIVAGVPMRLGTTADKRMLLITTNLVPVKKDKERADN